MIREYLSGTIGRQLAVAVLPYALAILVLGGLLGRAHLESVRFSERELCGISLVRSVSIASQRLRLATFESWSGSVSGSLRREQFEADFHGIGREVEKCREELNAGREQLGSLNAVERSLAELEQISATLDWEPLDLGQLVAIDASLRTLLTRVGDVSGLILDPELQTYYVMDVFLLSVPRYQRTLIELLVRLKGEGSDSGVVDGTGVVIGNDLEQLQTAVDSATAALAGSGADASVTSQLRATLEQVVRATSSARVALRSSATPDRRSSSAVAEVVSLLAVLDELQGVALSLEVQLLELRIIARWRSLGGELALAALCVALASGLGLKLLRSITRRIGVLERAAEAFAAGDTDAQADASGYDEMARLSRAFNSLASQIASLTAELRSKAESLVATNQQLEDQVAARTAALAMRIDAIDRIAVVAETDRRGRITYVNDKFVKLSKYDREELLGQDHRILNSGHQSREFFQDLWATIARGELWHGEIKNRAKDGTFYWVETWIFPQSDRHGRIEKFTAIRLDITERREMEERLRLAKTEAEVALQAKSVFLANMSHEIRTPLNGILGAAELVLRSATPQEKDQMAQLILTSGHSLMVIINDILDYSKLESGKVTLERVPLDLRALLSDAVSLFRKSAEEHGLKLHLDYANHAPSYIFGDPTRLRQIVLNLLSNAIKFTHKGEVTCAVRFTNAGGMNSAVEISIRDTGIGMTEEQLARIFERFTQADASTTRTHGGTGLGTSISQGLAALMNGHIAVSSTVNVGSTFTFVAPVELAPREVVERAKPVQLVRQYNRRVLLVDDNAVNQKIGKKLLEGLGLQVTLAKNGAEALEMERELAPHLVLMDIQMPVMDGMEASRRLIASGSRTPIVAMTANVMQEDIDAYLQLGMVGCVPKPFQLAQVVGVLDQFLPEPTVVSSARRGGA